MVMLHLRHSEIECHTFICFFSIWRASHSASIIISHPQFVFALAFPYNFCCCVESVGQFVHIFICIHELDDLMEFSS